MTNCLRCGKKNVFIHTCKPSKEWWNGFDCATVRIQKMLHSMRILLSEKPYIVTEAQQIIDKIQIEIDKIKEAK